MKTETDTSIFKPWIFIDTQFRRRDEPIFAIALLENQRRLRLSPEIHQMSRIHQLECLKQIVLEHYDYVKTLEDEKLPLFGKPFKYICHIAQTQVIEILPTGEFIREIHEDVTNGGASLKIGGQLIAGVEE